MQFKENANVQPYQSESSPNHRNFTAGLWHGSFLAFGMAQTDPTTVISKFVSNLAGSTVWVGGLSNGLTAAGALPQHARQVWTRDSQIG